MRASKTLQRYILAVAVVAMGSSCTQTKFSSGSWTLNRMSLLQAVQIPEIQVSTNGTATMKGYANDGGVALTLQIIQSLIAARFATAP